MARTRLRMMLTSPSLPLKFRRAGFPRYGFKAGISGGAFPATRDFRDERFASTLRAQRLPSRYLVLSRETRRPDAPPFERLPPLYPRDLSGRTIARIVLRMRPPFPWSPPIIPYSGFSPVRLEGWYIRRAFPSTARSSRRAVCLRPSCTPLPVSLFPRSKSRSAVRWYITVQAANAALPQGSSLRSGLCCPGPSSLIDPMRPTRQHISISRTPLIRDALAVRPDCDA